MIEKWSGAHYRAVAYPVTDSRGGRSGGRTDPTSSYRQMLNDKTSVKKLTEILEENFDLNALFVTLTYRDEMLPPNYDTAKKKLTAFLRRYREYRKRNGMPYDYIYVIEGAHGDHRIHHHIVTASSDNAKETLQSLWTLGTLHAETIQQFGEKPSSRYPSLDLTECVRAYGGNQAAGYGYFASQCYERLAMYITKEPRKTGRVRPGARMYTPGRTIRRPQISRSTIDFAKVLDIPEGITLLDRYRRDSAFGSFYYVDGWNENQIFQ